MSSEPQIKFRLLYFSGCPHVDAVRKILDSLELNYEEVDQSALSCEHPWKIYTSPSILRDGHLILGSETDSSLGGCTHPMPTDHELKNLLTTDAHR